MTTDCIPHQFEFQGMTRRTVVASFDGGTLSSDGGVLLLAEVDRRLGLLSCLLPVSRTIGIRTS
jgi:hypothetical protein